MLCTSPSASPTPALRSSALRWIALLLGQCPDKVMAQVTTRAGRPLWRMRQASPTRCAPRLQVDPLLSALLGNLADSNDPDILKLDVRRRRRDSAGGD